MGRTCEIAETCGDGSPSKKRKAAETGEKEEKVDRLSSLPDPVLIHILSLLPTRDAAKTLLIPTLGRLWDQTYNLDLDWCSTHGCSKNSSCYANFQQQFRSFISFMRSALNLHKSPRIFKFRLNVDIAFKDPPDWLLNFDFEDNDSPDNKSWLPKFLDPWLEPAVERKVETIELNLIACVLPFLFYDYVLPASVLRSSTLVELRLVGCSLKSYPGSCMKSLKCLYLKNVIVSDDVIVDVLSACPVLESLSLEECHCFYKVNCISPMLKKVLVSTDTILIPERQVEVSGPYITSLCISGWIERMNLGDLPSLHDATVNISHGFCCVPDVYTSVKTIFKNLSHAKMLTMHDQPILVAMIWELLGLQSPTSKWQSLALTTFLNNWHLPGVANLLRNSPSLERLDLHILPGELPHTPVMARHVRV